MSVEHHKHILADFGWSGSNLCPAHFFFFAEVSKSARMIHAIQEPVGKEGACKEEYSPLRFLSAFLVEKREENLLRQTLKRHMKSSYRQPAGRAAVQLAENRANVFCSP